MTGLESDGQAILLVRHGATVWNEDGRYQGRANPGLSTSGRMAAEALARNLAHLAVAEVWASPLSRAVETAEIIAALHGLAVRTDSDLIEIDYGAWEGMTQMEVKQRWPDLLRQWKRVPGTVRFPGGESLAEARQRMRAGLARIAGRETHGTIILVTHQTIIRLAILEATGAPDTALRGHQADTASPSHLVLLRGRLSTPQTHYPLVADIPHHPSHESDNGESICVSQ